MSDDFLNMLETFEPFKDSSEFSEDVSKLTSEKVPKQCCCSFFCKQCGSGFPRIV